MRTIVCLRRVLTFCVSCLLSFSCPQIEDSDFSSNSAVQSGGGVAAALRASLTLSNTNLRANTAGVVTAPALSSIGADAAAEVLSAGDDGTGGGNDSSSECESTSAPATAEGSGGGLWLASGASALLQPGSSLRSNAAAAYGGAAFVGDDCALSADGVRIENNLAVSAGGAVALSNQPRWVNLTASSVTGNAAHQGGFIAFLGGAPAAAAAAKALTLSALAVSDNKASVGTLFAAADSVSAFEVRTRTLGHRHWRQHGSTAA